MMSQAQSLISCR